MDILRYYEGHGEKRTIRNIQFGVGFNKQDEIHKNVS
jgi:hypothetical protein